MATGYVMQEAHTHAHPRERHFAIVGFAGFSHALLRIGAGVLFMEHGLQKLFGMFGGFGGQPSRECSNSAVESCWPSGC
jgi:hypothetical protein